MLILEFLPHMLLENKSGWQFLATRLYIVLIMDLEHVRHAEREVTIAVLLIFIELYQTEVVTNVYLIFLHELNTGTESETHIETLSVIVAKEITKFFTIKLPFTGHTNTEVRTKLTKGRNLISKAHAITKVDRDFKISGCYLKVIFLGTFMAITKTDSQVHIFSKVILSANSYIETHLGIHI